MRLLVLSEMPFTKRLALNYHKEPCEINIAIKFELTKKTFAIFKYSSILVDNFKEIVYNEVKRNTEQGCRPGTSREY